MSHDLDALPTGSMTDMPRNLLPDKSPDKSQYPYQDGSAALSIVDLDYFFFTFAHCSEIHFIVKTE